jgi:hypothetical protein
LPVSSSISSRSYAEKEYRRKRRQQQAFVERAVANQESVTPVFVEENVFVATTITAAVSDESHVAVISDESHVAVIFIPSTAIPKDIAAD